MALVLRGGPTGPDGNDVARSQGGIGIVDEILLRIGKPLWRKKRVSDASSRLAREERGRETVPMGEPTL